MANRGIMPSLKTLFAATVAAVLIVTVSVFQPENEIDFYDEQSENFAPTQDSGRGKSEQVDQMLAESNAFASKSCWTPNDDPNKRESERTFSEQQPELEALTCWTPKDHSKDDRSEKDHQKCKVLSCWQPNDDVIDRRSEEAPTKQVGRKSHRVASINPASFHLAAREIIRSLKNRDPMVVDPDVRRLADQVDSDPNAKWLLGLCFHFGFGVRQSPQKAEALYASAAVEGQWIACELINITRELLQSPEDEHNADYFPTVIMALDESTRSYIRGSLVKYAREERNYVAKYALAMSYQPGERRNRRLKGLRARLDSKPNRRILMQTESSVDLVALSKKIDQEDAEAMYRLALHFQTEHNEPASLIWLNKAAAKGHELAIQAHVLKDQVDANPCLSQEISDVGTVPKQDSLDSSTDKKGPQSA